MSSRPLAALLLVVLAVTARPALAVWSTDPTVNNPIRTGSLGIAEARAVSDGSGGCIAAWRELRTIGSPLKLYAMRVLATGDRDPAWPATGRRLGTSTVGQQELKIAPDGQGGLFAAWIELRGGTWQLRAQHLTSSGALAAGWADSSRLVHANTLQFGLGALVADGAGGVIAVWTLQYNGGDYDLYATRLTSAGAVVPGWEGPRAIDARIDLQYSPSAVSDGAGGLVVGYINALGGVTRPSVRRFSGSGAVLWQFDDVKPVGSLGAGTGVRVCSDGGNGAFVSWQDDGSGANRAYLQHFDGAGNRLYDTFGRELAPTSSASFVVQLIPDGTGGAFAALYADGAGRLLRLQSVSGLAPGWPSGLTSAALDIVADGAGGLYQFSASASGLGTNDILGWHLTPGGVLSPMQSFSANWVAAAAGGQGLMATVSDGQGSAIAVFVDSRSGIVADLYAQKMDRFGALGDARPLFTAVRDVKGDQGGFVRLQWNASYLDRAEATSVSSYTIWRQTPATLAAKAMAAGAYAAGEASAAELAAAVGSGRRPFLAGANGYAWEYVGQQAAIGSTAYSLVTETTRDSLPGSNPYTVFMVRAQGVTGGFWESPADSGYSVDNLPPLPPAPFVGAFLGGTTTLQWGASPEGDRAGYRLYRGTSLAFAPSPANRVVETGATLHVDAAGAPYVYKLTAVDVHGNESVPVALVPAGTTGAEDALPHELAFAGAAPNPLRAGGAFRFALPRAARVTLALVDAQGRRVRTVLAGEQPAGERRVAWDGRGDDGRALAAGVYFATFEAEGRSFVRRVAIVR